MEFSVAYYDRSAAYVRGISGEVPEVGLILGTGLGTLADEITERVEIPYADIPNFLRSTVASHAGKLVLGMLAGRRVVCMCGRFHYYEGYSFEQLAAPIRLFQLLGVRCVILTNAAGAVNTSYRPGDVMVIKDHINLAGASPMRGQNIAGFGPRFFDLSDTYTARLRKLALARAEESLLTFHEGVYQYFVGPHFETPAEIRAARILGADAVGMSTVTEALTAAHCGLPLLGMSLITNMAAGVLDQPISGEEVDVTAGRAANAFRAYLKDVLSHLDEVAL